MTAGGSGSLGRGRLQRMFARRGRGTARAVVPYKGDLGESIYKRALGVCISLPIESVLPREALFKGRVLVRNLNVST